MSNVNNENKKREETFKKTLDDFMEQYMREDTPEEERINSYDYRGFGCSEEDGFWYANICFAVEPYSKENTKWTYNKGELCTNTSAFQFYCFAKYKKVGEEYELQRVSMEPEYYEEFLAKFEEYKANLPEETVTTESIQADTSENYLASQEIETMSNGIFIGCGILLVLAVGIVVSVIRKRK